MGSILARRLGAAGHEVSIANSRAPETIDPWALETGARAAWAADVPIEADVLIVSVPLHRVPAVAKHVRTAPAQAIIVDTSNYFPVRDGNIAALDEGQVESVWVAEQYGRPIIKAWNTIASEFIESKAFAVEGTRVALPVSGDDGSARGTVMGLVEETGFDAFDAGPLEDSWRLQPGSPAYSTDLTRTEPQAALQRADRARISRRRDIVIAAELERYEEDGVVSAEFIVALSRLVY